MKSSEQRDLLRHGTVRDLLRFEIEAHDRLLRCASEVERRQAYKEIYARWPTLIAAFNRLRAGDKEQPSLGFSSVFVDWFEPWLRGKHVIEIGCGGGAASRVLADVAQTVTAIDVSEPLINSANAQSPANVSFRCADVTAGLPFADASFDAAYWNDVAEHLHPADLRTALQEIRRILRPSGVLCTVTCHRDDGPHDASMLTLPRGSSPRGVHMQEFTYREWKTHLAIAGFSARQPVVGINLIRKLRLLTHVSSLMRQHSIVTLFEGSVLARYPIVRWSIGADVICSVADKSA